MRHDRRPYLVKKLLFTLAEARAKHFLHPQFDELGEGCWFINPRCFDINGSDIRLGKFVHLMGTPDQVVHMTAWTDGARSGAISIGDYTVVLPGVRIGSASNVTIGRNCLLASKSYITDADWHDLYDRNSAPGASERVLLEDNVWLGDSSIVCKGVTIGENSIVGAGAVVTHDVPANSVAAGNPARVVKELDPERSFGRREDLFNGEVPYNDLLDYYERDLLGPNTVRQWLMSKFAPSRRH